MVDEGVVKGTVEVGVVPGPPWGRLDPASSREWTFTSVGAGPDPCHHNDNRHQTTGNGNT